MIRITHDYGYAYDLLAIAQIKKDKNPSNEKASINFDKLSKEIESQIGNDLHFKILNSEEYKSLYKVNEEIYLKIDSLKILGEKLGDAVFIDLKNHQRWVEKNNLQNKWFNIGLAEQKFGYEK